MYVSIMYVQMHVCMYACMYEGYPESKFRLRILPLQRCGNNGAQACRVFEFFVKARTQFADIWTVFTHRAVCF